MMIIPSQIHTPSALIPCRRDFHFLPHQEIGVRWMLAREGNHDGLCCGGILADDMGLGKTCQTIGLLQNSNEDRTTLIVCPVALFDTWHTELKACGFQVSVFIQSAPVWSIIDSSSSKKLVFLTTYSKLVLYWRIIAKMSFQRIVLDEGHVIRNKSSARFAAAVAICTPTTARWILSATPIQNGLADWKNLCQWLNCEPRTDSNTILLRRTMSELRHVIDGLPPAPVFVDHDCSIPDKTDESNALKRLVRLYEAENVGTHMKLVLWMRIQQFIIHPQIYYDSIHMRRPHTKRVEYAGNATKWDEFARVLIQSDESTIVFCNFQMEIDRVAAFALEKGREVFVIQGGSRNIGDIVDNARGSSISGNKPVVVIVQIVAGGVGLNLQFCSRILFLSRHWNPAVVHQAVGRAVRFGQSKVVNVHFFRIVNDFVDLDNIDMYMSDLHTDKIHKATRIVTSLYDGFHLITAETEGEGEGFDEVNVIDNHLEYDSDPSSV